MSGPSSRTAGVRWRPILLAACGMAALGCAGERAPGPWIEAEGHRWRQLHPSGSGGMARLDASRHGIDFVYDVPEERRLANRVLAEGQGVAVGDVDGDGLADLFFAGFGVPSALYRNVGDWRFEDATARSGLDLAEVPVRGAALVDVDGDRALDLLVAVHGGANRLYPGDGRGGFARAERSGLDGVGASTTLALADIDGDGDLDLYAANYKTRQVEDLYPPEALDINVLQRGPDGQLVIPPPLADLYAEHYRVDFDGRFVRRWELGEPDELWLNEGGARFVRGTFSERFRDARGRPLAGAPRDWGLAARFSDWDGDGDPDLYVANDFNSPDGLWLNRGDGTFDEVPFRSIRATSLSSMAVDAGDLDRDGDLDLVTTDMLARRPADRLSQTPNFEPEPDPPGVIGSRLQVNRNAVQLNRGDGTFAEAAWALGLAASDWTWGALLLDVDLDGWEDLLVTTGHAWDQLDGDANVRAAAARGLTTPQVLGLFPPLRQPNAAFRGSADGFEDVTGTWAWGAEDDISHGVAAGDLDADGDLDLVVTRLGEPPVLVRNDAAAPRVLVRLRGPAENPGGIGGRVTLAGHPVGDQVDEFTAGGTYLSSSEAALSFAAAGDDMTLTVRWPDGRRSRIEGVAPDREYEVLHPDVAAAAADDAPGAPGDRLPSPHFADVSDVLGHRHVEPPFDDRDRQPTLPVLLSRPGPGVSWFDAGGDGYPDLLVGAGRGGSPVLIPNRSGRFEAPRALTPAPEVDATALLPSPTAGGGWDLVLGLSAYEAASPERALSTPAAVTVPLAGGAGPRAPESLAASSPDGAGPPSATGPLAQADVDGDGDLDLFVGGRVIPGRYPLPADSRLLLWDGGRPTPSPEASAPFRNVGLVTGAVFTDVDLDGDPDLALATEWGPVRVFRNEAGVFREATDELGLGELTGRWNAIASGDFDGDGRPDLVATGWGTNVDTPAPYAVFHGDVNRDGLYDVVEAVRREGAWRPLRPKVALERPTPDGAPRLPRLGRLSYAAYRSATIGELFPALGSGSPLEARELRHMVLLNRPDGFEARPLPDEAQRSPAFGVAAADFDGDGAEDILLGQNFYGGRPGAPRWDAGRGLWLRGDGAGGFEAVPGDRSGIAVYGGARGVAVADYDRDGRIDVAIGVNGRATRLFRNRAGRPGLRVILEGSPGNPQAIGALVRLEGTDGALGPAREVRSGSGLARDEAVQTLGIAGEPAAVHVTWPGGARSSIDVPAGADEVRLRVPR